MSLDLNRSSNIPSREEILKRAELLIPTFKDRAEEAETDRRLLKKTLTIYLIQV